MRVKTPHWSYIAGSGLLSAAPLVVLTGALLAVLTAVVTAALLVVTAVLFHGSYMYEIQL